MDVIIQGRVGEQRLGDGTTPPLRLGNDAQLIMSELHGRYCEQSLRGNLYTACQTAGQILTTVAGTSPSFSLFNPAGSGVLLSLIRFEMVLTVAAGTPVIGAYMLTVNTNPIAAATTGTAVVPTPGIIGGTNNAKGRPLTACTVPVNPTLWRTLAQHYTGAITTIPNMPAFFIDFDGTGIIAQGCTVSVGQLNVDTTNATALCAVIWEEIPV
jgi:hypothetical protein